jgi:hypothetical protein
MDVIFGSDLTGSNYDATLYVYQCTGTASQAEPATTTDCEKILTSGVDAAITGNPVANLDAIYGISPGWLAFVLTNTGTRQLEIRLVCR